LTNQNQPAISVFSEFQPLKKVIVGRCYPEEQFDYVEDEEAREGLKKIARETEEDCQNLVNLLSSFNIEVLRPEITIDITTVRNGKRVKTPISDGRWTTYMPNAPMWPRDLNLVLGNKVASTYSRNMGRWLEGQAFYKILKEQFENGAQWVSMPPPLLNEEAQSYADYEREMLLFHAACFLKCGKHVFHTRPAIEDERGKGTQLGLDWVKREFPEFKFIQFDNIGHIDGKIAFLRPGLLMSWIKKEDLPKELQNWDVIKLESKQDLPDEFVKLRGKRFYRDFIVKWLNEWIGCVDETYFDVNMISIDEKTVILNGENPDLIKRLASYGIEGIPFKFRHRYFWDGGLHCITQDLVRSGPMEDYFS
jgi:glycine amidinotransferase